MKSNVSFNVFFLIDLLRRQEELRRMEEIHSQEMQKRKEMQLRYVLFWCSFDSSPFFVSPFLITGQFFGSIDKRRSAAEERRR